MSSERYSRGSWVALADESGVGAIETTFMADLPWVDAIEDEFLLPESLSFKPSNLCSPSSREKVNEF
ncbi:hypothetical protein NL676_018661 [Syzygium grande]|nr:hypothetical protein NL676_018661 [Syzygium grande]